MARNRETSWEQEFAEFISTDPVEIPAAISNRILENIHEGLNPGPLKVFVKLAFIQVLIGLLTLIFCPQFGISFTSRLGIMPYLMKFGESICMFSCGALFTTLSLFVAGFALKPEEVRTLRRNKVIQLTSLSSLSLGAFICVGGQIVVALGLVWLLGAIVGGALTLELGWSIRRSFARRVTI